MMSKSKPTVIVVGKILFDEYGPPGDLHPRVTIGGGAPQATMGAALALAARDYKNQPESTTITTTTTTLKDELLPPPPQPVILVAPVGSANFSEQEEESLKKVLKGALQDPPHLIHGPNLKTPRVRIWHNDEQMLQWQALDDSFGVLGADTLWRNYPSLEDYQDIIGKATYCRTSSSSSSPSPPVGQEQDTIGKPIFHMMIECGATAPGGKQDSGILLNPTIRSAIGYLGIEPILFPSTRNTNDGKESSSYSAKDAKSCGQRLQEIMDHEEPLCICISPDLEQYQALQEYDCVPKSSPQLLEEAWTIRDGPGGSDLILNGGSKTHFPAASLHHLVNPTGAGNAYAAAYTALRGSGSDAFESACIASGVGAVFCEYPHCPPYSWNVVKRVLEASREVELQMSLGN